MIPVESFASGVLAYAVERSVAFTVVFVVVAVMWLLLRKWMTSHAASLWFLLPLVVLVAPVERWIPNPWPNTNPIESAAIAVLPASVERALVNPLTEGFLDFSGFESAAVASGIATADEQGAVADQPVWSAVQWNPAAIIIGVWLLGLVAFLVRLARGQRLVPELLETATVLDADRLPVSLSELKREANVGEKLLVFESPDFESPAVWTGKIPGVQSAANTAAIILPEGLSARLSERELRWVLLHELAHLARRDHQVELVQRVLGAAFFFHPLVWVTNRIARGYREMACDDAALARCAKADRARCARALFEVVAHASALSTQPTLSGRKYRTTHAMASLFHSKKLTRRRIMRLIEIDRPLARGLRISALVPVLLASGVALAAARFPAVVLQESTPPIHASDEDPDSVEDHNETPATSIAETRIAVTLATDWLLADQAEDGGWHYKPQPARKGDGPGGWAKDLTGPAFPDTATGGFKRYHSDVALTALAVQALLRRASNDVDSDEVEAAIDSGVNYLLQGQNQDDGVYGERVQSFMIGQALATEAIALASASHMTSERKASLEKAVFFLERARNPYSGWRYDEPPVGDYDTRVTGYVMLALSAAYDVDVHAAPQTFAEGMNLMVLCEDLASGRTMYTDTDEFAFRLAGRQKSFPAEFAETPTAMHMRIRNGAGLPSTTEAMAQKSKAILVGNAPLWSETMGTIDYTYWWQGTEALAGSDSRGASWDRWSLELRKALLGNQVMGGEFKGTWPTVDAWSAPGLEAYTTASAVLALYAVLDAQ